MTRGLKAFGTWILRRLVCIRVCDGRDGCPAYDEAGNLLLTIHADARLALVLLRAMTEALKVVNNAKRRSWIPSPSERGTS